MIIEVKSKPGLVARLSALGILVVVATIPATAATAQLDLTKLPLLNPSPAASPAPAPAPGAPAPGGAPAKAAGPPGAPLPLAPVPPCGPAPVPPKLKRTPPRSTAGLVEKVKPLVDKGIPLSQAMVLVAPPFPVAGPARFSDDWKNARTTPCPHLHEGTDIFADFGTPIVASGPGTLVAMGRHAVGGLSMWVVSDEGDALYYAHMQKFASGLRSGQHFEQGTVLGEVGDTGNAEGGAPHLHFEVHPPLKGRRGAAASGNAGRTLTPAANPKPFLDGLLAQAEEQAPALVAQLLQSASGLPQPPVPSIVIGGAEATGDFPFSFAPDRSQVSQATRDAGNAALALGIMSFVMMIATLGANAKHRWWTSYEQKKAEANPSGKGLLAYKTRRPSHQLL